MPHDSPPVVPPLVPPVKVVASNNAFHVVSVRSVNPGERILFFDGRIEETPSRHSIQIGPDQHLFAPVEGLTGEHSTRYVWRFLNHSCWPNAIVQDRELIAVRPIVADEEVTFDYNTTEDRLSSPFHCGCGHCDGGLIRGRDFRPDLAHASRPTSDYAPGTDRLLPETRP